MYVCPDSVTPGFELPEVPDPLGLLLDEQPYPNPNPQIRRRKRSALIIGKDCFVESGSRWSLDSPRNDMIETLSGMMDFKNLLLSRDGFVATVQLNRPKVLNALNIELMTELVDCLESLDQDSGVRAIVLTGSEKAFAAGADIKEMADATAVEMLTRDQFARWDRIRKIKTPIIAAVSGFALGGGCELALCADRRIAADSSHLGQPEILLGVIFQTPLAVLLVDD